MVNRTFATVAILALTPVISALAVPEPAPSPIGLAVRSDAEVEVQPFSFVQWVEGIIANPDGDNLTPEEAVEAWEAANNATENKVKRDTTEWTRDTGLVPLHKRVSCNNILNSQAWAPDAVLCINYLARLGTTPCVVNGFSQFCRQGHAIMVGVTSGGVHSSWCQHIARAGGLIMDACWRADNTVQGSEYAWGNGNIAVHIAAP
ncbi:hypothetical protein QBC35DRAFT_533907 [Podospora australis]|uniref:Ecp2 effector protein domain-containing protein n=1 Tax=Podospora australis TaxID=1536484 RepID=A0AAN7AEN2_9PEZI|nr:hypothetical protein QBC35DRAFT_533907 [Podospora australis]